MTLRAGTMRLACMFSSILLFGAAGLLLFISLQDPTELTPQQVPELRIGPQKGKKGGWKTKRAPQRPGSGHLSRREGQRIRRGFG